MVGRIKGIEHCAADRENPSLRYPEIAKPGLDMDRSDRSGILPFDCGGAARNASDSPWRSNESLPMRPLY